MLAVIYTRVSTEEQARHGHSLEGQEQACRKKAVAQGANRVLVFSDEGVSGEILERLSLQDAIATAKAEVTSGETVVFIVYDPDRLSRRQIHLVLIMEELEKAGVQIEFVNFEWQNTPEGQLFFTIRGAIAEYEKEKIKIRTRMGRLTKARAGLLSHDPRIFSYRYSEGQLVVVPEQAEVYQLMVDMALAGSSPEEIARRLNETGVPGPKGGQWYRATVRRILKNETYSGVLHLNRHNAQGAKAASQRAKVARARGNEAEPFSRKERPREEWIPVQVPALITRKKWEALQEALSANVHGRRGQKVNRYLLSGILECACGAPMHGLVGKKHRYYACRNRHIAGYDYKNAPVRCTESGYLRADEIETVVWTKVKAWLEDPDAILQDVQTQSSQGATEREIAICRQRLEKLKHENDSVFLVFRRQLISIDEFEKAKQEIATSRESVNQRLVELEALAQAERQLEQGLENLREVAKQVVGHLDDLDSQERERLIKLLVKRATLRGTEIVLEARIPLELASLEACVSEQPSGERCRQ